MQLFFGGTLEDTTVEVKLKMLMFVVLAILTWVIQTPAQEKSENGATSSVSLTAEDITLLKLAGRPYAKLNRMELRRPTDIAGGSAKFLAVQFAGRGRRVAAGVAAREALMNLHAGHSKQFADDVGQYPAQMRRLAWTAAGLVVQGKDVPPPFSDEFNSLNAPAIRWMDDLRRSATKLKLLEAKVETAVLATVDAVEADFAPTFGTARIPTEQLHVRPGPYCQSLTIKNVGPATLTNVLLVGRVTADKIVTDLEGNQLFGDLFNRSLSTEQQADDARRYVIAENYYGSIPKGSVLYLPRLGVGDEVYIDLGYMTRGKDREGKNAATLAMYADQGRLTATDSRIFTQLPEPVRKTGPKPGERDSAPAPEGSNDKLYVGSVWHGTVNVVKARTREEVQFQVELIITERTMTSLRGDAWYIDKTGPRYTVMGSIKDGQIRLANTGSMLSHLPPGKLIGTKLMFARPEMPKTRVTKTPVVDQASAEFTYVPPK